MKTSLFLKALIITFFLGACASTIRSDVTRFNNLGTPGGQSFIVKPKDTALEGSLEFQSYAAEVREHMIAQGYRPAGGKEADFIVKIGYAISEPLEEGYEGRPAPYWGYSYFGYGYRHGYPYYYDPFYPYFHPYYGHSAYHSFRRHRLSYLYDTADYKRIVYERIFEMIIQEKDGDYVFEGRAVSIGRSRDLPEVIPYLIDSIFTDFPGQNGETVRVSLKADDY